MFYLNSYSIDELGIKMRNTFLVFMLMSAGLYYFIQDQEKDNNLNYILPLVYVVIISILYFGRNSFGKLKQDFIKIKNTPLIFWSSFLIFLVAPLMFVYSIQFMPGELYQQLLCSFFINYLIGYISFKILIPVELSRNHAYEYRQSAVTTRILEKENVGKTTPSIKIESKLKINIDDIEEEDKKAKESEEIINKLLQEQEELIRDNQKK